MSLFSINFNWFTNFTTDEVDAILTCEILINKNSDLYYGVFHVKNCLRESSFNMTRGRDEDIERGLPKFLDTRKGSSEKIRGGGGSENLYTSKPTGGGGPLKNWTTTEGGC